MRFLFACAVAVVASTVASAAVFAATNIPGTVVVAKSSPAEATLIWDATPRIVDLTAKPITSALGDTAIEIDAVKLLQARAVTLKADRVTLRVVYILSRQAASYGDPTMADRGPLVELTAKRSDIASNGAKWVDALSKGQKTPGLTIAVLGDFPTAY